MFAELDDLEAHQENQQEPNNKGARGLMIDIHVSVRRLRGRMQLARRDDDRARADDTLPEREGRPSFSKTLIGDRHCARGNG